LPIHRLRLPAGGHPKATTTEEKYGGFRKTRTAEGTSNGIRERGESGTGGPGAAHGLSVGAGKQRAWGAAALGAGRPNWGRRRTEGGPGGLPTLDCWRGMRPTGIDGQGVESAVRISKMGQGVLARSDRSGHHRMRNGPRYVFRRTPSAVRRRPMAHGATRRRRPAPGTTNATRHVQQVFGAGHSTDNPRGTSGAMQYGAGFRRHVLPPGRDCLPPTPDEERRLVRLHRLRTGNSGFQIKFPGRGRHPGGGCGSEDAEHETQPPSLQTTAPAPAT